MGTVKLAVMGLVSVVFLIGGVTMITPFGSEADAGGKKFFKKYLKNHVSNKDLELDHDKLGEWLDKIEEKLDNLPSGGGGTAGPCDVPPVWDEDIDNSQANNRFVPALINPNTLFPTAYCDKETGLTWEARPGDTDNDQDVDFDDILLWDKARRYCANKEVGGKKGWRLPSFAGLATLVDKTQGEPTLPANHPFSNVQSESYWSATTDANFPAVAWNVSFRSGGVAADSKSDRLFVWCARGGGPLSEY